MGRNLLNAESVFFFFDDLKTLFAEITECD